ncbi:MAG: TonB-dependent receptor [Roseateles sp.]|uniref:TonB-dependent receptor n=1 Tax=Roseateles sp. TaxID=1971397 RepID=UPI0039ED2A4D
MAQSTTGSIYGSVPAGTLITITSSTGLTRTVTVGPEGRYSIGNLPAGAYKVEAKGLGFRDITVTVGSGADVSFGGNTLETVIVSGSRPKIDISQVDTRTVFTADLLSKIAVGQSVNSVALLAPGVVNSTNYNTVNTNSSSNNNTPLGRAGQRNIGSFGGSAASENAYYINGYPVTNPLTNLGATSLGFDSISQVQVLTGGYGAEYGRSTGGVMSMVTKHGTNEWKGGAYAIYTPNAGRSKPKNLKYADTGHWSEANHYTGEGTTGTNPVQWTDNTLYQYRGANKSDELTYGVYVGGPIIKDRLFIYVNAEQGKTEYENINPTIGRVATLTSATSKAQAWREGSTTLPRATLKLDWNITDNHILEFTTIQDDAKEKWADYSFDYTSLSHGTEKFQGGDNSMADTSRLYIAKYTGYITDDLTVSALVGTQKIKHSLWSRPGYDPSKTYAGISSAIVPSQFGSIANSQPYATVRGATEDESKAARFDLSYKLGSHELHAGIDYLKAETILAGTVSSGPGYEWYFDIIKPTENIDGLYNTPASGGGFGAQGYYVEKYLRASGGKASTEQKAWYLEDRWQATKDVLLSLGLRNDSFTNYNTDGQAFVEQKNIWQPRFGAVWDLKGDSSLKVFGNIGRYALALPSNVAIRAANGALAASRYYTYTGIDADGTPTGLNEITPGADAHVCAAGTPGAGGVSANSECGSAFDPKTIAVTDLKPHYQDEFIVGMEQILSKQWSWGAKLIYRNLKSSMDDTCADGLCRVFNPGRGMTLLEPNGDGTYTTVHLTAEQVGLPKPKRTYKALDLFAEYQDGRLYGKIEYTWSRMAGNAEGQLNSSLDTGSGGQGDVSVTADWDQPQIMEGAYGLLPNDRTHQIKLIGSYKVADEWTVGGSAIIQSGRPRSCSSWYPYQFPDHYPGAIYYHYCGVPGAQTGVNDPAVVPNSGYGPSPRGSMGTTPWTKTFNVSVTYAPNWAKGLVLTADVLNVFNTQTATSFYEASASNSTRAEVNQMYGRALYYTDPRSIRLTARYDF